MVVGSFLLDREFRERERRQRIAAHFGFFLMAMGGVGAILVGSYPENTVRTAHLAGAGLAIGLGNLAILILGLALRLPSRLRSFMLFSSVVSVVALVCFAFHRYFGLGPGGMERIAAYPETIWLIWFGAYMFHERFQKGPLSAAAAGAARIVRRRGSPVSQ